MPIPHPESLGSAQVIGHVLADLVIILVAARLVGSVFVRLGQPRLVGEIVSGVLIGPTVLGGHLARAGISVLDRPAVAGSGLVNDLFPLQSYEFLSLLATVFIVLFMCLVGLEVRRRYLKGNAVKAMVVALATVAIPVAVGFLLASSLDAVGIWKVNGSPEGRPVGFPTNGLFVGAALAMTAFPLVGRNLQRKRVLGTGMGRLGYAAALASMPLAFIILATASISVRQQGVPGSVPEKVLLTLALLAVLFLAVRPLLRRVFAAFDRPGEPLPDPLLALIVVGALASGLAADRIGVHPVVGAFAFGACVPPLEGLGRRILERLRPMIVVIGIPVFLAVIGLHTDFRVLDWGLIGDLVVFVLAMVLAKLVSGAIAARAVGLEWRGPSPC
jgi:K+:H+ antiporter